MRDVRFDWRGAGGFVLEIDAFALEPGARTALLGPSGSGKSTLLALLALVAAPAAGSVAVAGQETTALSAAARDRLRADEIGVLFQLFNLLPYLSPLRNVLLPLGFSKKRRARLETDPQNEARRLLGALGLDAASIEKTETGALSVGQQQRVAAARALIGRPALILADEPTSALDPKSRDAFLDLLSAEADAAGAGVLVATHDPFVADRLGARVDLAAIARPGRGGSAVGRA